MDKFPSNNSSGELFDELFESEKASLLLGSAPLSGFLLSLWNDSIVRQLSDKIASLINSENFSEVCQSPINLLNYQPDSVGQEPLFAMTNLLNPASYLAKSSRANRHPESGIANQDLDSLSANVGPDTAAANPEKVSVHDVDDEAPRIVNTKAAASALDGAALKGDSARIEATLAGLRKRLQQQTEHLASVKQEMGRQAQLYQAKLDYLDRRYSAELQRLELRVSAYLDAKTPGEGSYSADAAAQMAAAESAYSTTYKVPSRPNSQWVSKSLGGIPIFLLLVVVGIVLALLIAVSISPYEGSLRWFTATGDVTKLLLPAMAVVIFVGGAIAFLWELRR